MEMKECERCDGTGTINNSQTNDPQWDMDCHVCTGDGVVSADFDFDSEWDNHLTAADIIDHEPLINWSR